MERDASHNALLMRWASYQFETEILAHQVAPRVSPERSCSFERMAATALLLPESLVARAKERVVEELPMPHLLRGLRSAGLVSFTVGVVFAIVGGAALSFYGVCFASAGCRCHAGGFDVGSYVEMLVAGIALAAMGGGVGRRSDRASSGGWPRGYTRVLERCPVGREFRAQGAMARWFGKGETIDVGRLASADSRSASGASSAREGITPWSTSLAGPSPRETVPASSSTARTCLFGPSPVS